MGFLGKLLGKKGESGDMRAAISIGVSGIHGLLFSKSSNATFTVHASVHIPVARKDCVSGAVVEAGELGKLVQGMLEKYPAFSTAHTLYAGLGGEFLKSSMFRAVFERDNPKEKIGEAEFKNLLEKAERASRENLTEHLMRQSGRGPDLRLLTSHLEEVLMDGYGVAEPVGFAGKNVEIALFNLYAEEPYIEFLQNIKRLCGAKKMFPFASSYAVAQAFMRSADVPFSGIMVDISSVLTSVSVVSKKAFLGTKPFSVGANIFTRALASNVHLGVAQAADMKEQYRTGKLSLPVSRKVAATLKRVAAVWSSGVELALEEFAGAIDLFPSAFYLYGEDADLPDLVKTLQETGRFSGVPFLEKRTYVVLTPSTLPYAKAYAVPAADTKLTNDDVVSLSLAFLSLNNPNENSELNRIVQRATKLAYS